MCQLLQAMAGQQYVVGLQPLQLRQLQAGKAAARAVLAQLETQGRRQGEAAQRGHPRRRQLAKQRVQLHRAAELADGEVAQAKERGSGGQEMGRGGRGLRRRLQADECRRPPQLVGGRPPLPAHQPHGLPGGMVFEERHEQVQLRLPRQLVVRRRWRLLRRRRRRLLRLLLLLLIVCCCGGGGCSRSIMLLRMLWR
jgi:hypothetical protein